MPYILLVNATSEALSKALHDEVIDPGDKESDILEEGFNQAERMHGVRYMCLLAPF